jgi:hypothetical protein
LRTQKYYQKNKEKILQYQIEFRLQNEEKIKIQSKNYYASNREKLLKQQSDYRQQNKIVISEKMKKYRENNTEKISSYKKEYYSQNTQKITERCEFYRKSNLDKVRNRKKHYQKNKRTLDPIYKFTENIKANVYTAFKRGSKKFNKNNKTIEILGCDIEFFRSYIGNQFTEGMNWDNHSQFGWHLDHIIPLSSAKTQEEVEKLCHYTNYQPLWWRDNLSKSDKIIESTNN